MKDNSLFKSVIGFVIIGALLQLMLVQIDAIDTPHKAAVDFLKKYYTLDAAMSDRLCEESRVEDDVDLVSEYIENVNDNAKKRGYGLNYMKFRIFHIETSFASLDKENAKIIVHARKDRAPRAAFPFIARIFNLSSVEEMVHELHLKKEDKTWRVCDFEFTG